MNSLRRIRSLRVHALLVLALWTVTGVAQGQAFPTNYMAALQRGLSNRLEVGMDRASSDMAAARVNEA